MLRGPRLCAAGFTSLHRSFHHRWWSLLHSMLIRRSNCLPSGTRASSSSNQRPRRLWNARPRRSWSNLKQNHTKSSLLCGRPHRPHYGSCSSVCPSVRLSVQTVRNSKMKRRRKQTPKLVQTFPEAEAKKSRPANVKNLLQKIMHIQRKYPNVNKAWPNAVDSENK